MTPTFKKLNFKAHDSIYILNSPESFRGRVGGDGGG